MTIEHILVGIDDSAPSSAALEWAAQRATDTGRELTIAHVIDDEWSTIGWGARADARLRADLLLQRCAASVRALQPRLLVNVSILYGSPIPELASAAETAALVVLGTHKTGYLRGRAFGSRSLQLAAIAPVSVAVVPESSRSRRRGIVAGIGPHDADGSVLTFAAAEAERTGAKLTLVHSLDTTTATHTPVPDYASTGVHAFALSSTPTRTRFVQKPPSAALLDAALNAELLIIGNSSRDGALGPIGYDILLNITAPTVIVQTVR